MSIQKKSSRAPSTQTCSCCGTPFELDGFYPSNKLTKKMKAENICFSCAFWKDKIDDPPVNREIIDGQYYIFNPWGKARNIQGYGSCAMYIVKNDGDIKRSNNVYYQGQVPDCFKDLLPNTAKFITKMAYINIKKRLGFKCQAKGCWDRYHCFWYNTEIEKENGPWNTIPASHRPGEEQCESFINKNDIYE